MPLRIWTYAVSLPRHPQLDGAISISAGAAVSALADHKPDHLIARLAIFP